MSGATVVFVVVEEEVHVLDNDRQLRMQILPLRVSCLCANSLLEHVTMIATATCKAICMQEEPLVGWGFPGFPLPHKLWGTDGALRPSSCITSAFSCFSGTGNPCGSRS
jgi:hypothetical protein